MERAKKQSKGRQRIEIKKVETESKRHVTFSKRKMGLFNKAAELNILTGAKVAALVFSPHDKCFSFGTPNCKSVVDSYFHTNASGDHNMINNINDQNYNNASMSLSVLEATNNNRLEEDKKMKMKKTYDGFWWDCSIDHENMSLDELMSYKSSLLNLKDNVEKRAMELLRRTPPSYSSLVLHDEDFDLQGITSFKDHNYIDVMDYSLLVVVDEEKHA